MDKRKAISKSVRFEVFKRDSFKCQYCGASAPEVVLNVDHIQPVSKGGNASDIANLITACFSCNSGKSDRLLTDDAAVAKQKRQLDQLQERREQLEMMAQWQAGLIDLEGQSVAIANSAWSQVAQGFHFTESGELSIRKLIRKYGLSEVLESMRRAGCYLQIGPDGKLINMSVQLAFEKIAGVCIVRKREREDPVGAELHHIVSSAGRRLNGSCLRWQMVEQMREALNNQHTVEELWSLSRSCSCWRDFISEVRELAGY